MRFRVIDIKTTGLAPPAEILEIGCVDVVIDAGGIVIEQPRSQLYRPLHGISPETMAVHHITERDFRTRQPRFAPRISCGLRFWSARCRMHSSRTIANSSSDSSQTT